MSREVGITAISLDGISLDGKPVFSSDISYTKEWIERVLEQNQDVLVEGRLIIACGYNPHICILKAVLEGQGKGQEIVVTHEDDIFAPPHILVEVLFRYWEQWHSEDPRWSWSQQTIREFFNLYKWAIIYIDVY